MSGSNRKLRAEIARNKRLIQAKEKLIASNNETLFLLHMRIAELKDQQLGVDRTPPIVPMRRI